MHDTACVRPFEVVNNFVHDARVTHSFVGLAMDTRRAVLKTARYIRRADTNVPIVLFVIA